MRNFGSYSGSLIDIDGYSVFVHEAGAGPTLVFTHGFPTSSFDWREMITELSDDFHCMAIDLR